MQRAGAGDGPEREPPRQLRRRSPGAALPQPLPRRQGPGLAPHRRLRGRRHGRPPAHGAGRDGRLEQRRHLEQQVAQQQYTELRPVERSQPGRGQRVRCSSSRWAAPPAVRAGQQPEQQQRRQGAPPARAGRAGAREGAAGERVRGGLRRAALLHLAAAAGLLAGGGRQLARDGEPAAVGERVEQLPRVAPGPHQRGAPARSPLVVAPRQRTPRQRQLSHRLQGHVHAAPRLPEPRRPPSRECIQ
mmetsp:Transcript_61524/g.164604  ORF Transcript_61524/g.164604 Transcript_61524/m.164604 type:complete len:245 (-) Transcript_61524:14-748(-)